MTARERAKVELDALLVKFATLQGALFADGLDHELLIQYQEWYTRALKVVRHLAPDRYDEFRRFYEPDPKRKNLGYGTYVIQDYLRGHAPASWDLPKFDPRAETATNLRHQVAILAAVRERMDSVFDDIEGALLANAQDEELTAAAKLVSVSLRAAGALAGVVLEGHLQRVAVNRGVKVPKKTPTIADLNDPLWKAGVYDQPTWRKIGFLAAVRNLCTHKKVDEPSTTQVREMIEGVAWVIKNVA